MIIGFVFLHLTFTLRGLAINPNQKGCFLTIGVKMDGDINSYDHGSLATRRIIPLSE